jgi:predicted ATPase
MITRIQARHYRCLRCIDQKLGPFQLLVGANATGKTTFLDVVTFLGELVSFGVEQAVRSRSANPKDLTWYRNGDGFELAIEAEFPEQLRERLEHPEFTHVRYEIGIGVDIDGEGVGISAERVWLKNKDIEHKAPLQRSLFPETSIIEPRTILLHKGGKFGGKKLVVSKVMGGNDNYMAETVKGYNPSWKQSSKKSALGNLPADESSFPVSSWLRSFLIQGIQQFVLNSSLIRMSSPPGQSRGFKPDGSNLPWVIDQIAQADSSRIKNWVRHLQTALPDLKDIRTVQREDDKHRYLVLEYANGLEIPSWLASDGTLRLLALTLPAYLTEFQGVYLIEEPENGIHPRAAETVFQSLSSVYDAQVFLATHSPVLLSLIKPRDSSKVLCFAKRDDGSTDIISGDHHPRLKEWQGDPNLSVYFAGGVLG